MVYSARSNSSVDKLLKSTLEQMSYHYNRQRTTIKRKEKGTLVLRN